MSPSAAYSNGEIKGNEREDGNYNLLLWGWLMHFISRGLVDDAAYSTDLHGGFIKQLGSSLFLTQSY